MKVYNDLGYGFLEKVYENAIRVLLDKENLNIKQQYPIKVYYKDEVVGDYVADLLIEDKIIVELKSIEKLAPVHEAQLLNYLKATGIKVGLLLNFSSTCLKFKRMVM